MYTSLVVSHVSRVRYDTRTITIRCRPYWRLIVGQNRLMRCILLEAHSDMIQVSSAYKDVLYYAEVEPISGRLEMRAYHLVPDDQP